MQTFIRKRGQGTFMHRKITLFYLGEIFALVNTKTNILFKLTTCDKFLAKKDINRVFYLPLLYIKLLAAHFRTTIFTIRIKNNRICIYGTASHKEINKSTN